jgi:hypothetical protein
MLMSTCFPRYGFLNIFLPRVYSHVRPSHDHLSLTSIPTKRKKVAHTLSMSQACKKGHPLLTTVDAAVYCTNQPTNPLDSNKTSLCKLDHDKKGNIDAHVVRTHASEEIRLLKLEFKSNALDHSARAPDPDLDKLKRLVESPEDG